MAKAIENNEKRFVFIYGFHDKNTLITLSKYFRQVLSFEECVADGPKKGQKMKSLIMWALKEFVAIENYKHDTRMLDFWNLLVRIKKNKNNV